MAAVGKGETLKPPVFLFQASNALIVFLLDFYPSFQYCFPQFLWESLWESS